METFGVIANFEACPDRFTVWSNFQGPFVLHTLMASTLKVGGNRVRLISPPASWASIRRRNFIRKDEFPYNAPAGSICDSGDYHAAMDELLRLAGYDALKERRERARREGRLFGIGFAAGGEPSGSNMAYVTLAQTAQERAGSESKSGANSTATLSMDPMGTVTLQISSTPNGQGHATVTAQIVADALGLDAHRRREGILQGTGAEGRVRELQLRAEDGGAAGVRADRGRRRGLVRRPVQRRRARSRHQDRRRQAVERGAAVRFANGYPRQQIAVLLYGDAFIKTSPEAARKFMVAYLKGARLFNDAVVGGRLAGPNADAVIAVLEKSTRIKDKALFRKMIMPGIDPNGRVNAKSLADDMEFYQRHGFLENPVELAKMIDTSFADAAVETLGEYTPKM